MNDPAGPAQGGRLPEVRVSLEVEIPSDVRYIERVVELVTRQCAEAAFDPRLCSLNVPVALTEALSNAILYGNGEDPGKHVRVRARLDEEALVVEVTDEGLGFDLDGCTTDPTAPDNLDREDGRGLFLMRSLMDRVERFDSQGNVVRLTLRRA
ncbi:MAG TPA: ATP-binding protein [Gemmatimonadaceae bacterium]|nr:ATP-binding protein [Gemmatimonadaceae bacterium]